MGPKGQKKEMTEAVGAVATNRLKRETTEAVGAVATKKNAFGLF